MKTGLTNSIHCILDGASGQYIPKRFASEFKRDCISGVRADDLDYLARGPVRGEFYWDVWQDVIDNAVLTDPDSGNKFNLWAGESGDIFLVPIDWEWDDSTESFRSPESDTLRRYDLPSYWASYLVNGDDSGIEAADKTACDSFIASEGLQEWTCADCSSESFFRHRNDSGNGLAGDCLEYTFVKIC